MAREKQRRGKRKSLSRAVVRIMVFVAVMIFLFSIFLNFVFAQIGTMGQLTVSGESMAGSISALVTMTEGFEEYAAEVLEVWKDIPEEIRREPESDAYKAFFAKFRDYPYYQATSSVIAKMVDGRSVQESYIVLFVPGGKELIYLLSSDDMMDESELKDGSELSIGRVIEMSDSDAAAFENAGTGVLTMLWENDEEAPALASTAPYSVGSLVVTLPEGARVYAMTDISFDYGVEQGMIFTVLYLIILAAFIIVIVIVARLVLNKRLVRPVKAISGAAEQYIADRSGGRLTRSHFADLDIHTGNELEELSNLLEVMERDVAIYENDLMQQTAVQERLRTELALAARIQKGSVPRAFPAFPERNDFDIYAYVKPAAEVGGDFYDFFLIDDDQLGFVIADISGRGVPAALFMMSSRIIINSIATLGYSPKKVMEMSNEKICRTNRHDMFLTAWFGVLDLATGTVTAVNAGHVDPVICRGGKWLPWRTRHNFVLGGMDGVSYDEYSIRLEKGDAIFLYTGGLTDAAGPAGGRFGEAGLLDGLEGCAALRPEETVGEMKNRVRAFTGKTPQEDDMTMLCLRYYG